MSDNSPFEFLKSITLTKDNLINDVEDEKKYQPFLVNRGLSYYTDTVFYAQIMNEKSYLDKKMQYEYYMNIVPPKKRYSKWHKPEDTHILDCIKKVYNYSTEKAKYVCDILDEKSKKHIIDICDTGGVKKKNKEV